jgi:hypothetical protein
MIRKESSINYKVCQILILIICIYYIITGGFFGEFYFLDFYSWTTFFFFSVIRKRHKVPVPASLIMASNSIQLKFYICSLAVRGNANQHRFS